MTENQLINCTLLFLLTAFVSWCLTGILRRYALKKQLLDIPNARSSHSIPTPRGGGISIVVTFLLGTVYMLGNSFLDVNVFVSLFGAGLVVAIIGFIDDHNHIAARWRLLGHFIAATWLVFWLGGLPVFSVYGLSVDLGWIGHILAVFALVWLLNLYNFMDGVDGIAGVEGLSSTLVAGLLFLFVFDNEKIFFLHLLMTAAIAGFLIWNFPPAKIFMGDAGSGFMGLMLGGIALYSAHIVPQMLWVWMILLGVFVVDASYTLFRRLLRGDKIYQAHRSHAYQFASRKYGSHSLVTLSVFSINSFWLAPWSFAVALGEVDGGLALVLAYIPLLYLAWHFRAGELE